MPTITIVFRGLMVLNNQPHGMEIGFVDARYECCNGSGNGNGNSHSHDTAGNGHSHGLTDAATGPALVDPFEDTMESPPVHVPRILTVKNGVLTAIMDLRNRPELGTVRNWQLVVTDPASPAVSTFETDEPFDRRTHTNDRDFRWITDLEADDFHNRLLTHDINTRQLLMVLYVRNGQFYTRVKSPPLKRTTPDGEPLFYGSNAAVVGCDIEIEEGGSVKLVAGGRTGVEVFEFAPDANTVYEISNGPPDVPREEPVPFDAPGHFHMYYEMLFNPPFEPFDLAMEDRAPAPDPILCGVVYLGRREDPL